jgi:hypothetical protein
MEGDREISLETNCWKDVFLQEGSSSGIFIYTSIASMNAYRQSPLVHRAVSVSNLEVGWRH